jgi:hypothetical protein
MLAAAEGTHVLHPGDGTLNVLANVATRRAGQLPLARVYEW